MSSPRRPASSTIWKGCGSRPNELSRRNSSPSRRNPGLRNLSPRTAPARARARRRPEMTASNPAPWSSSYRLVAAEKWKAKSAAMGGAVTEAFVEYARPLPGMKVLDLASGTGEPAISLAERVGPQGSVAAVDQSSELLEIAAERARNKKLANLTTQQADAHTLPFADRSFDLATCRFGVMFFADPKRALTELHRVLKPGARACFAAWGAIEQPYWQSPMKIVHRQVGGAMLRSEERRVGKECRSRWSPYH